MALRTGPSAQAANHFVYLNDDGADVRYIALHLASAKVLCQGLFKLHLMVQDGSLELFQLLDSPLHGEGCARAEEFALRINYSAYDTFCHFQ